MRSNKALRFLFEAASFVRSRAAHSGVSKREYLAGLFLYYIIVLKIFTHSPDTATAGRRLLCGLGAFAAASHLIPGQPN